MARRIARIGIQKVLGAIARLLVARFRPAVVGVTGSVGKTSTTRAISHLLAQRYAVRSTRENWNTQLGLPLTIIKEWKEEELAILRDRSQAGKRLGRKLLFWLKAIGEGIRAAAVSESHHAPEVLVLEYAADRPGDIAQLTSIAVPDVAVVTAIGEVPVHVEFFQNPAAVVREKARLIEQVAPSGFVVLNRDDPFVYGMRHRTRGRVVTFGFAKEADIRIVRFRNRAVRGKPWGVSFVLQYGGEKAAVKLPGVFGRAQAYAIAAAAAVAMIFGIGLEEAAKKIEGYHPPLGRMTIVQGIKGAILLYDAYNASPLSLQAALATLARLPAERKVAVLGDMLELGAYAEEAHRRAGKQVVAEGIDMLVAIGPHAAFIAEEAVRQGMQKSRVRHYEDVEEAKEELPRLIKSGDLVLIKGSRAMQLEKAAHVLAAVE